MDASLKHIAPYTEHQIRETLTWLETSKDFIRGVQFFYPDWTELEVISKLRACKTCADFQVQFIEMTIKNSIKNSMDSLEISGLDSLGRANNLYISNHRDIFLDSALLQNHLYDTGKPFTEISLGDNLMVNETMKAVAKMNNMFTVFRSGSKSGLLKNTFDLSRYLRYAIREKKVSTWIAQNNGRTKDGNDLTAPGLIKMLLLSGGDDLELSLTELNIVISTISYEYEPCAFEKAYELSIIEKEGIYKKKQFENLNSIVNGINEYKGKVKLVFEKLEVNNINFTNNRKKDVLEIAKEINRIVYRNYQLWKTNYMAHDLLYNDNKYKSYYSWDELDRFKTYLKKASNKDVYYRLLKIYVNPLLNKEN